MSRANDDDGFGGRFDPKFDPRFDPRFDPKNLLHVVVPDDIRELDADVEAYHREVEAARRSGRRRHLRRRVTPHWARGGLPSPLYTAVLLVIATTGLLLSVFAPVAQQAQRQPPVSTLAHPKQAAGTVGGLLPDVELVADANRIGTRVIRPAVFVLVPEGCQCASLVRQVVGQAEEVPPAPYTVVVSKGDDPTAAKLADAKDGGHGEALGVRDLDGVLARTYHASATAPTLLLVAGNGVLTSPPRVFHDGDRLEGDLNALHL